jgi:hypothetical protein
MRAPSPVTRTTCARCGAGFDCSPGGDCWCAAETFRLPMPEAASTMQGCFCPACLRAAALAERIPGDGP